ncbi:hypothetical protein CEXT_699581 [Caerostris extrusa]|uniref:Uncharacterized protein n=1 Tax=Caerostris extrusa TaxID=172846 RepID=A0AAV4TBH1_CAEEX|nr:hypothetical protein CEXT_699581 [Caerostris extrusa]
MKAKQGAITSPRTSDASKQQAGFLYFTFDILLFLNFLGLQKGGRALLLTKKEQINEKQLYFPIILFVVRFEPEVPKARVLANWPSDHLLYGRKPGKNVKQSD